MIGKLFAPLAMKVAGGIVVALLAYVAFLHIQLAGEKRHSAKLVEQVAAEVTAHRETELNFRRATAEATRLQAEYKARVEADRARITKEVSHDYQARLDDLRRRYNAGRVRAETAPGADSSGAGEVRLPPLPDAPGGPDATPAPDLQFNCEANSIQLEELQRWIREQVGVPEQ